MEKRILTLLTLGAALTVLGAACSAKTTISGNANVSVNVPVNTIINAINSSSTGDFSTNTSVNASVQAKTVTITANGVSPKTLTIASGTTVTFVNTDTIAHHIASNPHPTHTDLPGFENVNDQMSYSFTFTKKGTFGYHDHLDPFNTAYQGTIIVQ